MMEGVESMESVPMTLEYELYPLKVLWSSVMHRVFVVDHVQERVSQIMYDRQCHGDIVGRVHRA